VIFGLIIAVAAYFIVQVSSTGKARKRKLVDDHWKAVEQVK